MIRVLVVEDSLTIRERLIEVISEAEGFEVAGQAGDGERAVELCRTLRPDVVTMDMVLPNCSGVEATERIMAFCPTPILIVSASTNRGELFQTYDALAAGAIDVLEKPRADEVGWEQELLSTLRILSRVRVITHPRARLAPAAKPAVPAGAATGAAVSPGPESVITPRSGSRPSSLPPRRLVAIGGSTGGPGALCGILSALPKDFPLPILVVLHISKPFAAALAEWLDSQTALAVRYARHNEFLSELGPGQVLLAPADEHLVVAGDRLQLTQEPPRYFCRPSVDVLFESIAETAGGNAVGCLLTGMGRDGAKGLLEMRRSGSVTIAQDEASSVVFGMAGEAVKLKAVGELLPIQHIAPRLARLGRLP